MVTRPGRKPQRSEASGELAGPLLCYICAEGEDYERGVVRYSYGP